MLQFGRLTQGKNILAYFETNFSTLDFFATPAGSLK